MTQSRLRAGALELTVDAARGGSIMAFRDDGFDLLRPWDGTTADPRSFASFPLVPNSGRVGRARFRFAERIHHLRPNFAPEPHAIHGTGWTSAWRVRDASPTTLELELLEDAADAVFRFRAVQLFRLHPDRLELELAVTNRAGEALPFGIGHHPYFTGRDDALLSAEVGGVWLPDDANLPQRLEPVPALWQFARRRPVAELVLDHNFAGWSGHARVDWPAAGKALAIEAEAPFRHLVVYVPEGADFFCVEPVSHVGDGFNLMAAGVAGTGVRVLAPGETLRGAVRFRPLSAPA